MRQCKYCHQEFGDDTHEKRRLAGHTSTCKLRPGRNEMYRKLSETLKEPRVNIELICVKCETKYILSLTQKTFKKGKYRKHCTRSCANGRIHTDTSIAKIKASLADHTHGKGHVLAEHRTVQCVVCGKEFTQIGVSTQRSCSTKCARVITGKVISQRFKGTGKIGGYRKNCNHWKGQYYKNSWMDSSWEVAFAKRLDELHVKWTRKVETFNYIHSSGYQRRYYPDFFLPDVNIYVEIKGMFNAEVEKKLQAVKNAGKVIIILTSLKEINEFDLALSSNGRIQGSQPCNVEFKSP